MKPKYKIEEVYPNIFAVIIDDYYERAMTFLRVQEYYECPNPKFRGKDFNIWEFIEWYSRKKNGAFTYPFDWGGFNIPLKTAWKCYEGVSSIPDDWKSKWDKPMNDIVWQIQATMFHKKNVRNLNAYIIGAGDMEGWTFKHEVCHGLYTTNKQYKELMDEIIQTIPLKDYLTFRKNLIKMGYTDGVIDDEIQAYLNYGHDWRAFSKGVSKKLCKDLNKTMLSVSKTFFG